jgi:hypothetical protein
LEKFEKRGIEYFDNTGILMVYAEWQAEDFAMTLYVFQIIATMID